ncbi:hypothetical protein DSO57_1025728 [Entomophthora muscae]|uniref:Uncharacterized protein n=1 Tax=Entomophthora muscae TaxID=34485 RepID=A0ACC2UN62_9FUNG|nr:hypothetical protein DSO57_1025728 [Entomophthora muscae]
MDGFSESSQKDGPILDIFYQFQLSRLILCNFCTPETALVSQVTIEPHSPDLNPDPLQAASPRFFGLKSREDLNLEKPLKPTYEAQSMINPCPLMNPPSLANEEANLNSTPVTN